MVQGSGRPDITAKLHLIELPFYLLVLWWLLDTNGIVGAAIAWVLRITIDATFLFFVSSRILPVTSRLIFRLLIMSSLALFVFAIGAVIQSLAIKVIFLISITFLFMLATWFGTLTVDEKNVIRNFLKRIPIFNF